jgi:general L-amino acid transport system permease protein
MADTSILRGDGDQAPPIVRIGALRWLKENLFSNTLNTILTIIAVGGLLWAVPNILDWGLFKAIWSADNADVCRANEGGACWAVIGEKYRPMMFGVYPYDEHWRLVIALLVYVGAVMITLTPRFFRRRIVIPLWIATSAVVATMLWGGIFGLTYVDTTQFGGLPLTMLMFTGTILIGMPVAVLLALGRRSSLPAVKTICVTFIEAIRGVPLVTILFISAVVFPLFLPDGMQIDKLLRATVGMAIFFACYQAEVIRGGLQAIPRGQYEAAEALGLSYWQMTRMIILPQALRICLPGIMNHIIAAFKNTSLVLIIGLFDILTATTAVMNDPVWRRFYVEAYLFIAFVYFVFCFSLSKYSQDLEHRLSDGRRL